MNEQILNEAIEDVKLIKQVIGRTAESFLALRKIFLWWGLLFLVKLIVLFVIIANEVYFDQLFKQIPSLGYLVYGAFIVAGILIYICFSRKMNLMGLSKQLMRIWLYIIGFNFITPAILLILKLTLKFDNTILYQSKTAVALVTFAIGLYITYVLTNLKLTKWLSIVYIITGVISFKPGLFSGTFTDYLWPFTFLFIFGYSEYKNKKVGGN